MHRGARIAKWSAGVALAAITTAAIGRAQQAARRHRRRPADAWSSPNRRRSTSTTTRATSRSSTAQLKGWDGNPKFWRVEDGAIVGESTPTNPSGNSYIVYRDLEAKDFTLKFEIKVEGSGGSGLQYRSRTGLPWLANIPASCDRQRRARST